MDKIQNSLKKQRESGSETEQSAVPHQSRRSAAETTTTATINQQQQELIKKAEVLSAVLEAKSGVSSEHASAVQKTVKEGSGKESGGTGRTQGTTSSYEKAIEEIKVEHILKKSPGIISF